MRILLFALTGFGNKALDALLEESCQVEAIFTRPEKGPFPYYKEEDLIVYAIRKGMRIYENFDWGEVEGIIKNTSPDLLLVSTFHRIIPNSVISSVPLAVNIHPSLLPKYRGPMPIAWALFNGETETGVTAHMLTKEVDAGDILIQKRILIEKGDNENILRKKLAVLATEVTKELINQIRRNTLNAVPQDEKEATYFPKFKIG